MQSFVDLDVWQFGINLVKEIYVLTEKFPPEEKFEMTKQMRRASASVVANIAEGFGRFTFADKANKYIIARGECAETETFLHIAIALHFITKEEAQPALELSQRVGRMISGLIATYKK